MLQLAWQEQDYRLNKRLVTRGAPIKCFLNRL